MKTIKRHQFEAVSLLTTQHGLLDVTIVPGKNQFDWMIPSSMVLTIDEFDERIWNYLWKGHDLSVFSLCPDDKEPEKLVVLEGNTDVHRFALHIAGDVQTKQLRISDLTDVELSNNDLKSEGLFFGAVDILNSSNPVIETDVEAENSLTSRLAYIFQMVEMDGVAYIIPDLDYIAHKLVDLDS